MFPVHAGLLLVTTGASGVELTTTLTVPAALGQPFTFITSEYKPLSALEAFAMNGFWLVDV